MKRSYFKKKATVPMKRTKLRYRGVNDTSVLKEQIQAIAREIVIKRDGGCILRNLMYVGFGDGTPSIAIPPCNGYKKDGGMIYQADHLISRSNTETFADTRLIVCLCKGHHGWKSVGNNLRKAQYDKVVRKVLSKERVELWDKCEADMFKSRAVGPKTDLRMCLVVLKQELKAL